MHHGSADRDCFATLHSLAGFEGADATCNFRTLRALLSPYKMKGQCSHSRVTVACETYTQAPRHGVVAHFMEVLSMTVPFNIRLLSAPRVLARFMVTNDKFGEFVGNTAYKTDSEKYGWSFVFLPMLSERQQREIQQVGAALFSSAKRAGKTIQQSPQELSI